MHKCKTILKGRKIKEERRKNIKEVLKFVFIFRFAFHGELHRFVIKILKLSHSQRLIEACIKEGYVLKSDLSDDAKQMVLYRKKFYYLTKKGVEQLDDSVPKEIYTFRKDRHINLKVVPHNGYVIEAYFFLIQKFNNAVWISEWIMRNNVKRRVRLPDGILVVDDKVKIAVEVEKTYKTEREWKEILSRYRRNIRNSSCHGVLIVAMDNVFEGIKKQVHKEDKNFPNQHIFLTSFKGLAKNRLLCYENVLSLDDMVRQFNLQEQG